MRGWREVAPAGASVFWKKFRILLFPFAEDDFVADAGPLDGVDAFLANDPAIARGGIKAKAGRLRDSGSGFDGSPNDGVGAQLAMISTSNAARICTEWCSLLTRKQGLLLCATRCVRRRTARASQHEVT